MENNGNPITREVNCKTKDGQKSAGARRHTRANDGHPGINLEALASLQADELSKFIESLQGLAVERTAGEPPAPPTPT